MAHSATGENPIDKDAGTTNKGASKAPAVKPKNAPKDEADESNEPPSRELASKKDYQLNQALNLLKGLQIISRKQ